MPSVKAPADLTLEQAIGQLLQSRRTALGLKQIEDSVATGFALRSIRKTEQGKPSMAIRSLDAMAMYYNVPLEKLISKAKKLRNPLPP